MDNLAFGVLMLALVLVFGAYMVMTPDNEREARWQKLLGWLKTRLEKLRRWLSTVRFR